MNGNLSPRRNLKSTEERRNSKEDDGLVVPFLDKNALFDSGMGPELFSEQENSVQARIVQMEAKNGKPVEQGEQQKSFEDKIKAFEQFSSIQKQKDPGKQRFVQIAKCQNGNSRRWGKPSLLSSKSDPGKSTEDDVDMDAISKEGEDCGVAGAEVNKTSAKVHWTIRFTQHLQKIRSKLEQRCSAEKLPKHCSGSPPSWKNKGFFGNGGTSGVARGSRSSLSELFLLNPSSASSGMSGNSKHHNGKSLSKSCIELNKNGSMENIPVESGAREFNGWGENDEIDNGSDFADALQTGVLKTDTGSDQLESADVLSGSAIGTTLTKKSNFISELRRFYDQRFETPKRESNKILPPKAAKNKRSAKEEELGRCSYISADRIDKEIPVSSVECCNSSNEFLVTSPLLLGEFALASDAGTAIVKEVVAEDAVAESKNKSSMAPVTCLSSAVPIHNELPDSENIGIDKKQVTPGPWRKPIKSVSIKEPNAKTISEEH